MEPWFSPMLCSAVFSDTHFALLTGGTSLLGGVILVLLYLGPLLQTDRELSSCVSWVVPHSLARAVDAALAQNTVGLCSDRSSHYDTAVPFFPQIILTPCLLLILSY